MPINVEDMVGTFEYFLEIAATLFYAISGVRLAAVKNLTGSELTQLDLSQPLVVVRCVMCF